MLRSQSGEASLVRARNVQASAQQSSSKPVAESFDWLAIPAELKAQLGELLGGPGGIAQWFSGLQRDGSAQSLSATHSTQLPAKQCPLPQAESALHRPFTMTRQKPSWFCSAQELSAPQLARSQHT